MQQGFLFSISTLVLTGSSLLAAGNGLKGEYFNNTGLLGTAALTRTDATVDFEWAQGGPGQGVDDDFFSARWTGQVEAPATGAYSFTTVSNNGVRLWINHVEVIHHWSAHGTAKDTSVPVNLTAGQTYDVKMEFYEYSGVAAARLLWTPPGQPQVAIPQTQLYSPAVTAPLLEPVYLSSLNPTFQANGSGPYQRDRSNGGLSETDGRVISLGGIKFARGLGTRARSELRYALQGKFLTFLSQVGVDDEVGGQGSVVFEVWLDGVRVFVSPVLHGSDAAKPVSVDVTGKNELKLIVLDGGDGTHFDHADWADAHVTATPGTIAIPPAPANVKAVPGDRRISISWSPSTGADSYNVYRGTTANGEASDPIVSGFTGTTFHNVGLTNGAAYYYRIVAVNDTGMSARSSEVSATPAGSGGGTPPLAPSGLSGVGGDKQITLTWTAPAGVTSYALFRGTVAGAEGTTPVAMGITGTSFTNTGLLNGTKYFYKLAAFNGAGMGALSNEADAIPAGVTVTPTPTPTGLTSTAGDAQISLAWTAISTTGATYSVFRGAAANAESTIPVATGLTSPAFTNTGLTNGVKYFFKVSATANGVSSALSNETSATPAPAPPPAPSGLTSTAGDKQVVLAWTAVSTPGATYNVFRGTTSNGESSTPIATALAAPTFTNTGLLNGTPYFFKVTAVAGGVASAMSNESSATPAPLAAPANVSAGAGNTQVVVSWNAVPGAATYNVYQGTAANGEAATPLVTGLTNTTFTNTGLINGTTYFYKVAAVSATLSVGLKSSEASAMPTAAGIILTQAQQDAFKFLRQSTFGPNMALVNHVVQVGKSAFIDEQMAMPPTPYPDALITMPNMELVSEQFFQNAISGPDQLRQRVAWALSEIFVVSAIKVDSTEAMVPYIRMLEQRAFDNVKDIMHDVTLSPAMGEFLDMVNNKKFDPNIGALPNENYAREWLQLFSIGLVQLQNNGTPMPGSPATYDQSTVADMARALTGWTYGDTKTTNPTNLNPRFYAGPMKPVDTYHDTGAKTILGVSFPAGQGSQADFDMALTTVFNHANVGPFLVRELIQRLVTSNPSSTYIGDVVAVFNNNGQGVRGDLKAVIKAILLHPEAATTGSTTFGKFSEPALFLTTVCRVICTNITDHPFMSDYSQNMAQQIWFAPSVFNYFSPNYHAGALFAPEMQIWSTANAITRTNWVSSLLSGGFGGSLTLNLAPFTAVAADPNALTDTVNALLMGGTMSTSMRGAMITAINATPGPADRVLTALYVAASSMQYQVEH